VLQRPDAARLAGLLLAWRDAGVSGFRLRPAVLPTDLERISRDLVPELVRRGAFRAGYEAGALRGLLGLPRPANRYAVAWPCPKPQPATTAGTQPSPRIPP
jgi:hypothetical protein